MAAVEPSRKVLSGVAAGHQFGALKDRVDLIVYDFDGVMTDNRVIVNQDGTEGVVVSRADGLGVGLLRKLGLKQMILSTETNPVVGQRAQKLGIGCIQGSSDKAAAIAEYCVQADLDLRRVLFVGNDVNDMGAMRLVGLSVAPADAHPSIRDLADHVTLAGGGEGVVRELADLFLADCN